MDEVNGTAGVAVDRDLHLKLTRPRPIRASKRRDAKSHSRWQPLEDGWRITDSVP